jgi:hypothetical protein
MYPINPLQYNPINPPIVNTTIVTMNKYTYEVYNLIPHTSVQYRILLYNDENLINTIYGLLDGDEYKAWTTDDYIDDFIKTKVDSLK